jgi:hypothetical protein
MRDTKTFSEPRSISDAIRRVEASSQARGAIGTAIVTIATVNDALEQLESGAEEHGAVRGELLAALNLALARVPDIEAKGISLQGREGQERVIVDTEALAATLWKDPRALHGLSEGLSAALAGDLDDNVTAPAPAEEPSLDAEALQCARVMAQMRVLESMPSTSRHRLELLV